MGRYLIIADDITGANDTGVQLKRRGIDTIVTLRADAVGASPCSYVLDTESRSLSGEAAYKAVRSALEKMDLSAFRHVVKKVDSTLRGNIAHEVLAVDEALWSGLVIFMPALPDLGRTTESAIHMLHGKPIIETEMALDPKTPVTEHNLNQILSFAYDEPIVHYNIATIEAGDIDFGTGRVFTFDALTNAHMQTVVNAALQTGKSVLWVGSSGIVDRLMEAELPQRPAVALATSLSETSRGQVAQAIQNGTRYMVVPAYELLNGADKTPYIEQAVELLENSQDVIILSSAAYDRSQIEKSDEVGKARGLSRLEVSQKVQELMGEITASALERVQVSGIFLTGGDTAIGFFEQIGASSFQIISEVQIGIPLMQVVGGRYDGLKVITKAGAFGQPDAILYSFRKLKEV